MFNSCKFIGKANPPPLKWSFYVSSELLGCALGCSELSQGELNLLLCEIQYGHLRQFIRQHEILGH